MPETAPSAGSGGGAASATLAALQRRVAAALAAAGIETAALDSRWLISGVLGLDRAAALLEPGRPLDASDIARIEAATVRRLAGEPVARILGTRAFHGLDLEISAATLDPRPDTETLVDGVLGLVGQGLAPGGEAPRFADIGTGTGAILIALLAALPKATGVGVDISPAALAVARRNADRHGVAGRMTLVETRWAEGLAGPFDCVVANPPYIASAEIAGLSREVRVFDPRIALDGGPDGLDAYRALVPAAARIIAPGGWLAMEVGEGQADAVAGLIRACSRWVGDRVRIWADLSGIQRCVAVQAQP